MSTSFASGSPTCLASGGAGGPQLPNAASFYAPWVNRHLSYDACPLPPSCAATNRPPLFVVGFIMSTQPPNSSSAPFNASPPNANTSHLSNQPSWPNFTTSSGTPHAYGHYIVNHHPQQPLPHLQQHPGGFFITSTQPPDSLNAPFNSPATPHEAL